MLNGMWQSDKWHRGDWPPIKSVLLYLQFKQTNDRDPDRFLPWHARCWHC
jgi:hypothetical protein